MKNLFKHVFLLMALLISVVSFPSCSKDEEENNKLDENVFNGHDYVDLGLSVKWATMNIGASTPEGYGNYYAWGETSTKVTYSWENYKWSSGSSYTHTLTKYCTNSTNGTVDNKTSLELSDDAAHTEWGGKWRMPTKAEFDELRTQCTWNWTSQGGVNGYKVIGKNGNFIFLPASGYCSFYDKGEAIHGRGYYGQYWSNTLDPEGRLSTTLPCDFAYYLDFVPNSYAIRSNDRCIGYSLRPVCP